MSDMFLRQLECATDHSAAFCIYCGQPDEPELHDPARCSGQGGTNDVVPIFDAVEVFDRSCEQFPDLGEYARALHCAILARAPLPDKFENLADLPVGDYVNHPSYLEMRLRMKLTGTAGPTDDEWATALRKLLTDLGD